MLDERHRDLPPREPGHQVRPDPGDDIVPAVADDGDRLGSEVRRLVGQQVMDQILVDGHLGG